MTKSPITIIIICLLLVTIVVSSVMYYYTRETTSIEDKYMYRESEEIDTLYHQTYLDRSFLDDGITLYSDDTVRDDAIDKSYTVPDPFGDIDEDGLSNQEEYEYGTDPFEVDTDGDGLGDKDEIDSGTTQPDNPDTDGDGISDGQDPFPNDPTKGGAGSPPGSDGSGGTEDEQSSALVLNQFYKHVCNNADEFCDPNEGKDAWKQFVYAEPGDLISFFIYIQLNTSDSNNNYAATLADFFGSNLAYHNNAILRINNEEIIELDDFQYQNGAWYNGLTLPVGIGDTMTYEIYFETIFQPQLSQSAINLARLELWIDLQEKNILDRRAFVFKK